MVLLRGLGDTPWHAMADDPLATKRWTDKLGREI